MKKIKLNNVKNKDVGEYILDSTEKYIINIDEEMEMQKAILSAFMNFGVPPALKNYHAWLFKNGFNLEVPNPTNEAVAKYYGNKPLWKTEYSQGIVVKDEN